MKTASSRPGRPILSAMGDARSVLALGEVLWDVFADDRRLGGAPLNFAAHYRRLGNPAWLISAVGNDALGREASMLIARLGLDTSYLQTRSDFPTGTAGVRLDTDGSPQFEIVRPAAYDDLELSPQVLQQWKQNAPAWVYFGTLFASSIQGRRNLDRLLNALDASLRFLDLNLRPGTDDSDLAIELLEQADVVKLNAEELERIQSLTSLSGPAQRFCELATAKFGWQAVAITLGNRGCAVWANGSYAEAPAAAITVVDTVGAGDAFSAAFVHGLSQHWSPERIARFANGKAAETAGQAGALPQQKLASGIAGGDYE